MDDSVVIGQKRARKEASGKNEAYFGLKWHSMSSVQESTLDMSQQMIVLTESEQFAEIMRIHTVVDKKPRFTAFIVEEEGAGEEGKIEVEMVPVSQEEELHEIKDEKAELEENKDEDEKRAESILNSVFGEGQEALSEEDALEEAEPQLLAISVNEGDEVGEEVVEEELAEFKSANRSIEIEVDVKEELVPIDPIPNDHKDMKEFNPSVEAAVKVSAPLPAPSTTAEDNKQGYSSDSSDDFVIGKEGKRALT